VTNGISELRPLAADITNSCHNSEVLPGLLPKVNFTGIRRISPTRSQRFEARLKGLAPLLTSAI
jgi:hypothetical protein